MYLLARKGYQKAKQRKAEKGARAQGITPTLAPANAKPRNVCEHRASLVDTPDEKDKDKNNQDNNAKCQQCEDEKKQRHAYRWKLMLALAPAAFLAGIDTTIVATAVTSIASHFGELQQFNWIVTAYTLTSTAFIPAFGQIADIFGRHTALQTSIGIMLIGSTLCAAAQTWGMLLFGRALQGISAAGIMNIIKIVLSDKVSLAEQSKNNTIFTFCYGVFFSVGPVIGGALANSNWRYCFVISIPIAVICHVLIFFLLRKELVRGTHQLTGPNRKSLWSGLATIDLGGMILFVLGAGLLILGVTWGGTKYPWKHYQVLLPLVIGAVLFASFFVYEYMLEPGRILNRIFPKQKAMIPWALFRKKDTALLTLINCATGAALYSAFYFIAVYWTLVEGMNPKDAGLRLLYYTPGLGIGAYSAMFMCNVFPRQTFYPLWLGSLFEGIGFAFLVWATSTRNGTLVSVMMAIAGGGTGVRMMPETLHGAGVWKTKIASIMSLLQFAIPFGGTLQIAIMSSTFYNKFQGYLSEMNVSSAGAVSGNSTQSIQDINALPAAVQLVVREKAARAIMWSFVSALPLMALSIAAAMSLGNVWIQPKKGEKSQGEVLEQSFLLSLITGTVKQRKRPVETVETTEQVAPALISQETKE